MNIILKYFINGMLVKGLLNKGENVLQSVYDVMICDEVSWEDCIQVIHLV